MGYIDLNYVKNPRADRRSMPDFELASLMAIAEKDPEAWSDMKKRIAEVDSILSKE